MSALATALVKLGHEVTGSDRTLSSPNVKRLERIGIEVFPDDGSGVVPGIDEIIVSTAIEPGHPALVKASELGLGVTHRAKALAEALSGRDLVAVAGTCGKSTVTAMLSHILAECGADPFCVNGANVPGWEGAVRFGSGRYAVAEVDESDKSLTAFRPYAAVITNASADHYSKDEMDAVFDAFIRDVPGPVLDAREGGEACRRVCELADDPRIACRLKMPGRHNRVNAAIAVTMAALLGFGEDEAIAALSTFAGVERRLQLHGGNVYDDYAHNPEKISAMWEALAESHPRGICVIWRPHGFGPLRKLVEPLAKAFNSIIRPQDKLLLLPVYDAGGTADRGIGSVDLHRRIIPGKSMLVDSHAEALDWCVVHHGEFEAFVTCGARDPDLPLLASRIAQCTS